MKYYTHIIAAVFLAKFFPLYHSFSFFALVIVFALLPDIDTTESMLGKRMKPISFILKWTIGHRKLFHSLWFLVIGFLVLTLINDWIAAAFLLAVASHIVADTLTKEGTIPLWPLPWRVNGPFKTGSLAEHILLIVMVLWIFLG